MNVYVYNLVYIMPYRNAAAAAADVAAAAATGPRRMGVIYGSAHMRSGRPFFGWGIRRAGSLASPHSLREKCPVLRTPHNTII